MSGGYWNYKNDDICRDIYGWDMSPNYGERGWSKSAEARNINPFEDREISELVYDVFCLLHSCDWYKEGDIGEDTYKEDVKHFKDKWFNRTDEDKISAYKQDLQNYADALKKEFN